MKISRSQLKKIIHSEKNKILNEQKDQDLINVVKNIKTIGEELQESEDENVSRMGEIIAQTANKLWNASGANAESFNYDLDKLIQIIGSKKR